MNAETRNETLETIMYFRACGLHEAEAVLRRIEDRLAGYTHAEVVQRHPLPPGRDEACGTQ